MNRHFQIPNPQSKIRNPKFINPFFSTLSLIYIAGIFLLADSPVVSDIAAFNPYSLLHIPLYGVLTILLVLSFRTRPGNSTNSSREMRPVPCSVETTTSGSLFHWDSINLIAAGIIALVVAITDEIHQTHIPSRNASITDIFLDIVGIVLCILKRLEHMSGFSKIKGFLR